MTELYLLGEWMTINYLRIIRYFPRFILLSIFYLPVTGIAQTAESMPAGTGKEIMMNKCATCHGLSTALVKRASARVWEQTINKMINSYSAEITDSEKQVLIGYLAEHYNENMDTNSGQQTVAEQCFRCHGDGMWQDVNTDRQGWFSVVYRMIGRGGKWTQQQVDVMAEYLAITYPQGEGK